MIKWPVGGFLSWWQDNIAFGDQLKILLSQARRSSFEDNHESRAIIAYNEGYN